jgi:nickel-dependent lactate racemase
MATRNVDFEVGGKRITLAVPQGADVLSLPRETALADPARTIRESLDRPIGTPSLAALIEGKKPRSAVIVVSDNTRPVPYRGPDGILEPLVDVLRAKQVRQITILVATGTHRVLAEHELRRFLPESVFAPGISVLCHDCTDRRRLRAVGMTARGTQAELNTQYLDADLRILTGLVEPHFMAGFSGGRKSVCPGIVSQETTYIFHGPELMGDPRSDSFVLAGNPCHEEALAIARLAPPDFIVNVTIDEHRAVTGVFAGDMEQAHAQATAKARGSNAIPITAEYDFVVTHAGFVGINHYQAAKAACEGVKAVRSGGTLLLVANHTDVDPVGGPNYRKVLPLLQQLGPAGVNRALVAPDWTFIPEQWEVQMWGRALAKLGRPENLIYCAPQLTGMAFQERGLPGTDGGGAQLALDAFLAKHPAATVAVLKDGPYGVPVLPEP